MNTYIYQHQRAAAAMQVVSTMGTMLLEEVAAAASDPSQHMFQLYVIKDRDFTKQLVQVMHDGLVPVLLLSNPFRLAHSLVLGGVTVHDWDESPAGSKA